MIITSELDDDELLLSSIIRWITALAGPTVAGLANWMDGLPGAFGAVARFGGTGVAIFGCTAFGGGKLGSLGRWTGGATGAL